MYGCNNCGYVFHDLNAPWQEVDDRDELIEETILKCPKCQSTDVGIADTEEDEEELEELYEQLA